MTSTTSSNPRREAYRETGFLVVRRFFSGTQVAELRAEADRLQRDADQRIAPENARCRYMPHHESGEPLFECFDPVLDLSPPLQRLAGDARLHELLGELYGEPACLFKDKLIFKPSGARGYGLHQDIPLSWDGFPRTFLSALIPIDDCDTSNGCTQVFRGYHHGHLSADPGQYMLDDAMVDESRRVDLELEAGDLALFHGLTPHRSGPNSSSRPRRTLYLSFNALSDGGHQREQHYETFIQMMRTRIERDTGKPAYFA